MSLAIQMGTFGPERNMTRSEAAAIFARLLADKNGDSISPVAKTKFSDVPAYAWYSGYVKYLNNNGCDAMATARLFLRRTSRLPVPSLQLWRSAALMCTAMVMLKSWSSSRALMM